MVQHDLEGKVMKGRTVYARLCLGMLSPGSQLLFVRKPMYIEGLHEVSQLRPP